MSQTLLLFSENLLSMMRGALMMLFVVMVINLYPRRKENSILNFLFWLLTIMAVSLLISFGFMIDKLQSNEYFSISKVLIDLCFIPLIGSYLLKILIPDYISTRKVVLSLVPTIVFLVMHMIIHNKRLLTLSFAYTLLIALIVIVCITVISIRYDRYLKNNFSNIENKTVQWVRIVAFIFVIWYVLWGVILKQDNRWFDSAYYLFMISIWIYIYRYSLKHVTAFQTQELFDFDLANQAARPLANNINNKLEERLKVYMEQESPWLNPSLTLSDMAAALNTNRTYLSKHFNQTLQTTFYDYLNDYRINHACKILVSEPHLSLAQVAEKSGFNYPATFSKVFIKHTGCTPGEYRRQQQV